MNRFLSLTLFLSCSVAASAQTVTDIFVSDKVVVQRCILEGPSSRMIAVGHPGGFNYAFDAVHCAPVYAWFGGFIDFKGEINGRGGSRCPILGISRPLGTERIPFRVGNAEDLPETLTFHGYRRDAASGNPTFLFAVNGVPVEQTLASSGPDAVSLAFAFPDPADAPKYYRLDPSGLAAIELGEGLRWSAPGVIEFPAQQAEATVTLSLKPAGRKFVRKVPKLSGAQVFQNYCSACHSIDGTKLIGPSFKDLWGRAQTVTRNGKTETLTVDEDYIRESIAEPQAAIVKGFELVPMANFSAMIPPEQIDLLIGYLKEIDDHASN